MCGLLTDIDIRNMMDKGTIKIINFEETCLTPVGYDLRVGELGFSWNKKRFVKIGEDGKIIVNPGDTVLVSTLEDVSVSKNIGGTIHSKVSLVSHGFTHISTTLDPGWKGKMLIQIGNNRRVPLALKYREPFCTLLLYKTETPAKKPCIKPPERKDIIKWIEFLLEEEKTKRSLRKTLKQISGSKVGSMLVSLFFGYSIVLAICSGLSYFLGVKIDAPILAAIIVAGTALSAAIMSKIWT